MKEVKSCTNAVCGLAVPGGAHSALPSPKAQWLARAGVANKGR